MPDETTEQAVDQAVQQARDSLFFDLGGALGSGLGSGLTSGLTASNAAIGNGWANISLNGIQQQMNQLSAITVGTPSNNVYVGGIDVAASASFSGVQVVTVPWMPPGEVRYIYDRRADGMYGFSQIEPNLPQEVYQYQAQLNTMMNWYSGAVYPTYGQRQETTEQRIAREEREVKERAKRSAAEKRAEQLMFSILKPEQVRQYLDNGYFETEVDDRIYRIHKRGHSQNVELIVKGKVIAKYCAHPMNAHQTPVQDTMISQLLALKHNEAAFLKTANKTVVYG